MATSGERLREAMRVRGWSKTRLSKVSGVDYRTISRLQSGDYVGYVDTWVRLCNVMDVSLDDVLKGD